MNPGRYLGTIVTGAAMLLAAASVTVLAAAGAGAAPASDLTMSVAITSQVMAGSACQWMVGFDVTITNVSGAPVTVTGVAAGSYPLGRDGGLVAGAVLQPGVTTFTNLDTFSAPEVGQPCPAEGQGPLVLTVDTSAGSVSWEQSLPPAPGGAPTSRGASGSPGASASSSASAWTFAPPSTSAPTPAPSATAAGLASPALSPSASPTGSAAATPSPSASPTGSSSPAASASPTGSAAATPSPSASPTGSAAARPSPSASSTGSSSPAASVSPTGFASPAASASSGSPPSAGLFPVIPTRGPVPNLSSTLIAAGNASGLFPVITPAPVSSSAAGAPPRKAAHGSVPAGREADVITRAFGTSVVAAQVVGLIILALAVAYTVIQLSARRRLRPQLSGQAMAAATPIDAERGRGQLGDLANGLPRRKAEEPQMACDGRLTASHGQTHRPQLEANDHVTAKFAELDTLIAAAAASFEAIITQLRTADRSGDQLTSTALAEVHAGIAAAATSRPSGSADTTQRA